MRKARSWWKPWRRGWLYLFLGTAGFIASVTAVAMGWLQPPSVMFSWEPFGVSGYVPDGRLHSGSELALVFVGSPTCAWSNAESLPATIETAKVALLARANSSGQSFAAIAAVKSSSTEDGHRYIQRFGRFDEITLGRGWANIGLLKYVYQTFRGRAASPQIIVVERTIDVGPPRAINDEKVILRRIGTKSIEDWVRAGAPLPSAGHDLLESQALPDRLRSSHNPAQPNVGSSRTPTSPG